MKGIVSYGAYLPISRLDRDVIFEGMGWLHQGTYMKGEKCVANFDEDSVTMAVASAMNCLEGYDITIQGKTLCRYHSDRLRPKRPNQVC